MKLITQDILKEETPRKHFTVALSKHMSTIQLTAENPNSVDGELRINHIDFLSVPHIKEVVGISDTEATVSGDIDVELVATERIHGADGEEEDTKTNSCNLKFKANLKGGPRKKDDENYEQLFQNMNIELVSYNLSHSTWE